GGNPFHPHESTIPFFERNRLRKYNHFSTPQCSHGAYFVPVNRDSSLFLQTTHCPKRQIVCGSLSPNKHLCRCAVHRFFVLRGSDIPHEIICRTVSLNLHRTENYLHIL